MIPPGRKRSHQAVGRDKPNHKADVRIVNECLMGWDHARPISGFNDDQFDFQVESALTRFQRNELGMQVANGIIEPWDETMEKLACYPGKRLNYRHLFLPPGDHAHLTDDEWEGAAREIGCEARLLRALALQESQGQAFQWMGRRSILFEPSHFDEYSSHAFTWSHPQLTHTNLHYGSYHHQWQMFEAAYWLDSEAAIKATSWGLFHLLGIDYVQAGYTFAEYFMFKLASLKK